MLQRGREKEISEGDDVGGECVVWLWSFLYGNGSVVYDNDDLNGWF
jgi:hypothetical protein